MSLNILKTLNILNKLLYLLKSAKQKNSNILKLNICNKMNHNNNNNLFFKLRMELKINLTIFIKVNVLISGCKFI